MDKPEISDALAAEYDHIFLIDRSSSMGYPSKRFAGKTRWQECEEYCAGAVAYLSQVDADGVTIITFAGQEIRVTDNVKDINGVIQLFQTQQPNGSTPLHLALRKAQEKRKASGKPTFVHVYTDGVPDSKPEVDKVITEMVGTMQRDEDLAISFLQVGDDAQATKYLKEDLDDGQHRLGLKFDAIDTTSLAESEGLNVKQLLYKALND